ncbi:hypothetical protein [Cupriavidus sp. IDO]|nr:hypothetical protein [Cupriavidus sp. IDO]
MAKIASESAANDQAEASATPASTVATRRAAASDAASLSDAASSTTR